MKRIFKKIAAAFLCGAMLLSLCGCNNEKKPVGNIGDVTLMDGDVYAVIKIMDYGEITAKLFPEVAPNSVAKFTELAERGYYDMKTIHRVIDNYAIQGGSLNGDGTDGVIPDADYVAIETSDYARHFYGALCYANAMGRNTTQFYIVNADEPVDLSKYPADAIREESEMYAEYAANFDKSSQMYEYYNNMAVYYNNLSDMLEDMPESVEKKYTTEGGTVMLDGGYTVFGQVYEGFDVIEKISAVKVENNGNDEISKPVQDILITSVTIGEYTE